MVVGGLRRNPRRRSWWHIWKLQNFVNSTKENDDAYISSLQSALLPKHTVNAGSGGVLFCRQLGSNTTSPPYHQLFLSSNLRPTLQPIRTHTFNSLVFTKLILYWLTRLIINVTFYVSHFKYVTLFNMKWVRSWVLSFNQVFLV